MRLFNKRLFLNKGWVVASFLNDYNDLIYVNGLYVAVGDSGVIAYSEDFNTWETTTVGSGNWKSIAYGNGLYVVVGTAGIVYSSDLETWNTASVNFGGYNSIAYGNGKFVAVNGGGNAVSENGTSFTESFAFAGSLIGFGNGKFLKAEGGGLQISTDLTTWENITVGQSLNYYGHIKYLNNRFVVTTGSGQDGWVVVVNNDKTVTKKKLGVFVLYDSTYLNGMYTIVGANGYVVRTPDFNVYNVNKIRNTNWKLITTDSQTITMISDGYKATNKG